MTRFVIAAAAILLPVPVAASTGDLAVDRLTAQVPYKDLDLASTTGRGALISRIKSAAVRVCSPEDFTYPYRSNRRCFRAAFAGGIDQMEVILPSAPKG
jgi:UrcA family protein